MNIADIDNKHRIYNTILWQYEKSYRINAWVYNLSKFGYEMCGKLFDEIMDGLVNLYGGGASMARSLVQSLIGAIGFDWSAVADVEGVIDCIMHTRFFGVANFDEFYKMSVSFGFGYSLSQFTDGGLVLLSMTPSGTTLKTLWEAGISIPLTANQKSVVEPRCAFCFMDYEKYYALPDEEPRLGTEMELSYFEVGHNSGSWELLDVINESIWS